ncbi:MAG TPA: hypothetical protein DIW31_08610 [Bacteroidales bacterium]|nr:hypothetical protein [Bacteroidales bacterium]
MAGIKLDTQREQIISVVQNIIKDVRFNSIAGVLPNCFQIKNYGTNPIYVGTKPNVSASANFELVVVGGGGAGVFSYPRGCDVIYMFTVATADVLVRSFINDEMYSADLDKTQSTTIINNTTAPNVTVIGSLPAGTNNIGDVDVLSLPALPAGTNNIGDVDVLTLPAIPTGTNIIGKVKLVDEADAAFGTVGNPIEVNTTVEVAGVTVDFPATPLIENVTMTNADTEYSYALPANCKRVTLSVQDGDSSFNIRLAFETGKVATPTAPYLQYKGNVEFDSDLLKMSATPGNIYFGCSSAGKVMQILAWN